MDLKTAQTIALQTMELLKPHCHRIAIAGSIRRLKPNDIKDIEIVAIPKPYDIGLFESGIATIVNQWTKVKGNLEYGKCRYTQRILPQGVKLDLFFAETGNWGLIYAIRTGSADYSHKVLASKWVAAGYHSKDGYLHQGHTKFATLEEIDLYQRIGLPYLDPQFRNV